MTGQEGASRPAPPVRHHRIVSGGANLHVAETGSGPPAVLIHGLGGPPMWQRLTGLLSKRFTVFSIDLPGFGESGSSGSTYSVSDHAGFVHDCLNGLKIRNATLIGISYGGQVAGTLAAAHRELIGRLVLVATTGFSPGSLLSRLGRWITRGGALRERAMKNRRLVKWLSDRSFYDIRNRPDGLVERFLEDLSDKDRRAAWLGSIHNTFDRSGDLGAALASGGLPVLIVWGANDRTISVKVAHRLHAQLPQSTLRILDRCAHSVPLEKPEELSAAIADFARPAPAPEAPPVPGARRMR